MPRTSPGSCCASGRRRSPGSFWLLDAWLDRVVSSVMHECAVVRSSTRGGSGARGGPGAPSAYFRRFKSMKHSSGEEDPWEDKLSRQQIRGWRTVSAEGLQGEGSCKMFFCFLSLSHTHIGISDCRCLSLHGLCGSTFLPPPPSSMLPRGGLEGRGGGPGRALHRGGPQEPQGSHWLGGGRGRGNRFELSKGILSLK